MLFLIDSLCSASLSISCLWVSSRASFLCFYIHIYVCGLLLSHCCVGWNPILTFYSKYKSKIVLLFVLESELRLHSPYTVSHVRHQSLGVLTCKHFLALQKSTAEIVGFTSISFSNQYIKQQGLCVTKTKTRGGYNTSGGKIKGLPKFIRFMWEVMMKISKVVDLLDALDGIA